MHTNKIVRFFFKTCPKTGRIIGINKDKLILRIFFPLMGLAALIWFLLRVVPKPSRLDYPCQQVAAPIAFSFIAYLASFTFVWAAIRKSASLFKQYRYVLATTVIVLGLGIGGFIYIFSVDPTIAGSMLQQSDHGKPTGTFTPIDKPNEPIGTPKGIIPGRVTWAFDPLAAKWDGKTGLYFEPQFNSQGRINHMLEGTVLGLTNKTKISEGWDALFRYFNKNKGKGEVGYKPGEKIVIKVNLNNNGGSNKIDAYPQLVYALLDQLVNVAGVPQENITVYDAQRKGISAVYNYNYPVFSGVKYDDWGEFVSKTLAFTQEVNDTLTMRLPSAVLNASYMINMGLLKRHCEPTDSYKESSGQTAVTLCAKNQFGTVGKVPPLHATIRDFSRGMGSYNSLVDLMAAEKLGGNTLIYLLDAFYAGDRHNSNVTRFKNAPFNNNWPSSLFASLDPVAIESVGIDFLNSEMPLTANADNYLHEAALIGNPPSKVNYLHKAKGSLGVHEHWNNPVDKQYSRNLGKKTGIELYKVPTIENKPVIDAFYANSQYVIKGDSLKITWATSGAKQVTLDGKKLTASGSVSVKPEKTGIYTLKADGKNSSEIMKLKVLVFSTTAEYQAEEGAIDGVAAKGAGGQGWTGTGWVKIEGPNWSTLGSIEWGKVVAANEGVYNLIFRYTGKNPQPVDLAINGQVVSTHVGFEVTDSWAWKDFVFPVKLKKGDNIIKISCAAKTGNSFDKLIVAN